MIRLLHAEDHEAYSRSVSRFVETAVGADVHVRHATSRGELDQMKAAGYGFDGILLDLALIDVRGAETYELVRGHWPDVPIYILADTLDELPPEARLGVPFGDKGDGDSLKRWIEGIRVARRAITGAPYRDGDPRVAELRADALTPALADHPAIAEAPLTPSNGVALPNYDAVPNSGMTPAPKPAATVDSVKKEIIGSLSRRALAWLVAPAVSATLGIGGLLWSNYLQTREDRIANQAIHARLQEDVETAESSLEDIEADVEAIRATVTALKAAEETDDRNTRRTLERIEAAVEVLQRRRR